jgi:hypothetical protein
MAIYHSECGAFGMWLVKYCFPAQQGRSTRYVALGFFLLMFPPKQFLDMVEWTNCQLNKLELLETSESVLLKLFGMLILTTNFEFVTSNSFWQTTAWSKYQHAPQFDFTGMSKDRSEDLF